MDTIEGELGWDDLGRHEWSADAADCEISNVRASEHVGVGCDTLSTAPIDAVAEVLLKHFKSEFASTSLSHAPQMLTLARRYFNVNHGYVLRKLMWVLVPTTTAKVKAFEGELSADKDWTARTYGGLEIDIEEPDLYIPAMSFITYVLLCGVLLGLQNHFGPETLPSIVSFSVLVCVLEVIIAKVVLSVGGVENALVIDLACLLGYKYVNLSVFLSVAIILGYGNKPDSLIFMIVTIALICSSAIALLQSLRKLARMQVVLEQQIDLHKMIIKGVAACQVIVWWLLMPHWPQIDTSAGTSGIINVNARTQVFDTVSNSTISSI